MITLYSTGCPKCIILERRLVKNDIYFELSDNVEKLIAMGYQNAPILQIDDAYLEYADAMKTLKAYEDAGGATE